MKTPKWISPAEANAMLFDSPMGQEPDFGFALLRPRAKDRTNLVADLARAKLQPRQPTDDEYRSDGLWPITASSSRIVTAPRTSVGPDVLEAMFHDYDAKTRPHQKLLAVVLTMKFSHDWQSADILSMTGAYALEKLSIERRLTSMVVVHTPSEELSRRRPHAHCVVLARVHRASGWGELHHDLVSKKAQELFRDEWQAFQATWAPRFRDG